MYVDSNEVISFPVGFSTWNFTEQCPKRFLSQFESTMKEISWLVARKHRASCLYLRAFPGICTYDTGLFLWHRAISLRLFPAENKCEIVDRCWNNCLLYTSDSLCFWMALTHWEQVPRDRRRGEAGEHVVGAAEVCEVGAGHGLTSTLTPHQDLPTLGLGCWRVAGVTGSHLHHPGDERKTSPGVKNSKSHIVSLCRLWNVQNKRQRKAFNHIQMEADFYLKYLFLHNNPEFSWRDYVTQSV